MRSLWDMFQSIRFRNKMVITYITMALIPFVIFAGVSGSMFVAQARNSAIDHTAQMTEQVSDSIDIYINSIDKLAEYISLMMRHYGMIAQVENDSWRDNRGNLERSLHELSQSHPEVAGILIAMHDDRLISSGMTRISRDPFLDEDWYRTAAAEPDKIALISSGTGRNIVTNKDYSVDDVFSLAKAIRDPETQEVCGVMLLDVRHNLINESINRLSIGEEGFVFVLDGEDNMVYTPLSKVVYRVDPNYLAAASNGPVTMRILDGRYQIYCKQSEYTSWKIVGVFSLDEVMRSVNNIYYTLGICIVITVVLVILVSFKQADSITRPISKLRRLMKEAESGDLSVRFNVRYNDEIADLGLSFNHMLDRISHLVRQVYEEQQSKRDAELKSLQEQIKPHFLYNTLDTISWMARDYEATDIVKLVDALTSMFRVGLSHGKEYISMKEELKHVSNYLYIQQIRYKDRLRYDIRITEKLYRYQVPKLILQPLVENAIYHGIKQKRGGGVITIDGEAGEDGKLRLSVSDDGAGMSPQRLELLRSQLGQPSLTFEEKPSFGLFYIDERIRLSYGEGYGVALESKEGEGTVVTLTLPQNYIFVSV